MTEVRTDFWLVLPGTTKLVSPYQFHEKSKPIREAQPFTASMLTVYVADKFDGFLRGKNDIMVMSRTSLEEQPLVERIHFYERDFPEKKHIRHLFAENMFLTEDYSGGRLWLELDVLELDTNDGDRDAARKAFTSLASTAGAVFPAILPYAYAASAVTSVVEKMVSAFEEDKHVVRAPISLYSGAPTTGRAVLQQGAYVLFATPQPADEFTLQRNGQIKWKGKPSPVSYAVFDIAPAKRVAPAFVMTQKIATLLTQMRSGNPRSATNTLDFLTDTLTAYSNFGKLERALELKQKQTLTAEEKALLESIRKIDDLKPFLHKS